MFKNAQVHFIQHYIYFNNLYFYNSLTKKFIKYIIDFKIFSILKNKSYQLSKELFL